mmetsp:Transcript_25664/g.80337  ORF Transcript_25664/g.80337 Transcript_25664/m.80337 type:complete len:253 (+) Transcript_25664:652-1410(+)
MPSKNGSPPSMGRSSAASMASASLSLEQPKKRVRGVPGSGKQSSTRSRRLRQLTVLWAPSTITSNSGSSSTVSKRQGRGCRWSGKRARKGKSSSSITVAASSTFSGCAQQRGSVAARAAAAQCARRCSATAAPSPGSACAIARTFAACTADSEAGSPGTSFRGLEPTSCACLRRTVSTSGSWAASVMAGESALRIPPFWAAISPSVSPSSAVWSRPMRVTTAASGRSTKLVESCKPPMPTSSKMTLGCCSAK